MTQLIIKARESKERLPTNIDVPPKQYDFIVTYPQTGSLPRTNASLEKITQISSSGVYVTASPYCLSVCSYCPYTMGRLSDKSQLEQYLNNLENELDLRSSRTPIGEVTSVYFGGGTPSVLSPSQIERLVRYVQSHLNVRDDGEISFEVSPNTLVDPYGTAITNSKQKLELLRDLGINRISIGIQTFDDNIDLNRCQNSEQARGALELLSRYFSNFNVDLMHGLPFQTLESWEQDLNTLLEFNPPSITIYRTRLQHPSRSEARKTNLAELHENNPSIFPTSDDNILMRIMATEFLYENKYHQNLAGWFVKNQTHDQQQQRSKWRGGNYLGFGVKAYSYVDGEAFVNVGDVKDYIARINNGHQAVERGKELTKEELMKRTIIFSLKSGGINIDEFTDEFGKNTLEPFDSIFSKLNKEKLITIDGKTINLTYNGILYVDRILKHFF